MKNRIIFSSFIFCVLSLSSCGPNKTEQMANNAVYIATSNALKQSSFLTETAQPSQTPLPTLPPPTQDLRSNIDKCIQSGVGVRYAIIVAGGSVSGVSLTWENDTGGTNQGDYNVPFCKTYTGFVSGNFLYISAQITEPTSGAGSIECRIYVGNTIVANANAIGFPSIATCSGSK